jgi:hypothetical protein
MDEESDHVDLLSGSGRSCRSLLDTATGGFGKSVIQKSTMTAADIVYGRNRKSTSALPSVALQAAVSLVKASSAKPKKVTSKRSAASSAKVKPAIASALPTPITVIVQQRSESDTPAGSDSDREVPSFQPTMQPPARPATAGASASTQRPVSTSASATPLSGGPALTPTGREPMSDISPSTSFSGLISTTMSRPFHGFSTEELLSANYLVSRELKDRLRRNNNSKPTQEELEFRSVFVRHLHLLPLTGPANKDCARTTGGVRGKAAVELEEEVDNYQHGDEEHEDEENDNDENYGHNGGTGITPSTAEERRNHGSSNSGVTPPRKRPRKTYTDVHDEFILSCGTSVHGMSKQPWVTLAEQFTDEFPDYEYSVTNRTIKDRYENLVKQKARVAAANLLKERSTTFFRALHPKENSKNSQRSSSGDA